MGMGLLATGQLPDEVGRGRAVDGALVEGGRWEGMLVGGCLPDSETAANNSPSSR